MITFNPLDVIKASDINANFAELKEKTDPITSTADADWQTPTLINSWVDYGGVFSTAGYRIDGYGYVHLKGLVKNGTVGTACFTLPAGYRPNERLIFGTGSTSAFGQIRIYGDSDYGVYCYAGNNIWFTLDGITFKAEQ